MSFRQNKLFWIILTLLTPLLFATHYGIKVMTSVYKTDFGNGVVIYADDYVKSGHWIFDCQYSRLINRNPLPPPTSELKRTSVLTIGNMYTLSKTEKQTAIQVIKSSTALPDWHKRLRYVYSGLDEYSDITTHLFDLLTTYEGRVWGVRVRQNIGYNGESDFDIVAEPYNPETYVDYPRALQTAAKSCPIPQ